MLHQHHKKYGLWKHDLGFLIFSLFHNQPCYEMTWNGCVDCHPWKGSEQTSPQPACNPLPLPLHSSSGLLKASWKRTAAVAVSDLLVLWQGEKRIIKISSHNSKSLLPIYSVLTKPPCFVLLLFPINRSDWKRKSESVQLLFPRDRSSAEKWGCVISKGRRVDSKFPLPVHLVLHWVSGEKSIWAAAACFVSSSFFL